jgi:hypothetical protein
MKGRGGDKGTRGQGDKETRGQGDKGTRDRETGGKNTDRRFRYE